MPERPSQSPSGESGPTRPRGAGSSRPRTDRPPAPGNDAAESRAPGRIAASIDKAAASLRTVRRLTGARIAVDLQCTQCGYNLRGLDTGTACPECGKLVLQSLAMTPDARAAAERVAGAGRTYGTSNLATAAFAVVVVMGPAGIFGAIGTAVVCLGCWQRMVGLMLMNRHHPERNPGDRRTFGGAILAASLETGLGSAVLLSLFFDLHVRLAGTLGPAFLEVLVTAWAGSLGLGIVASALMVDALARQYSLDVERSRLPFIMGFLAPGSYLVAIMLGIIVSALGGGLVSVLLIAAVLVAVLSWVEAGWVASAYVTGISDLLNGIPSVRMIAEVRLDGSTTVRAEHTTPEQQAAARKLHDDDSPIPMD